MQNGNETGDKDEKVGPYHPPKKCRFTSSNQPKNNGRKPSQLKRYIKDNNLGIEDVRLIMKFMLTKTEAELEEIQDDVSRPMMVRTIVRAYLHDYECKNMQTLDVMLNRIFGFAKQEIDQNVKVEMTNKYDFSKLSTEELEAMQSAINKIESR